MRIRAFAALFLAVVFLTPALVAQDRSAAALMAAIEGPQASSGEEGHGDLTIDELLEELGLPGASVAVIKDFAVHWEKGYGVGDVETGAPVDHETMFQAASISKPVTAMAVLRAVQDGLFTLDTDINDILTSWQLDGGGFTENRPVTPRGLHSHTSGLGDGFGYPGYEPDGPIPTPVQTLDGEGGSNTREVFMEREPGTFAEYSGGGITVMQVALSDARGAPFPEVMRRSVLEPIGMTRSSFEQPISPANDRNAARGHDRDGEAMGPKWHVYPEMAAAGLWTTAGDLARFAIEVQKTAAGESARVLDRAHVQEMLSPVGVGDFAVGFVIQKDGEGWYFSHGGGNWGFLCTLVAHKTKGYGLAIMTNGYAGGDFMREVRGRIERHYDWDSRAESVPRGYDPPPEREEVEVSEEVLARYVGEYKVPDGVAVTVTLEDGRLFVTPTGGNRLRLFPETETRFFLRVIDAVLEFTTNDAGEVDGIDLRQEGEEQRAEKIG
ncbi:MAG: serine hydrolase [Gemmatimonadetes bacterium]|nr:serine hydrolase [Gemmatimonadota bacterium]